MRDLFHLTLPFVGSIYAQFDTLTLPRWEVEDVSGPAGSEWLICCGSLRIYLTPRRRPRGQRP
jgi:hypothetical protein